MPNDELLTTEEAALLLGLSHKIVCCRVQQNRIEFTKNANGQYFIPRREVDRILKINADERDVARQVIELYQSGMTLDEVGKKFGLTRQGVRYRLVVAGVPRRGNVKHKSAREHITKERLEKLYLNDRLSLEKIAAELSVSDSLIWKLIKFYQIPKRLPIKKGGYIIDRLRDLKVGEKVTIELRSNRKYLSLTSTAVYIGIKISIRNRDVNKFEVTRIG